MTLRGRLTTAFLAVVLGPVLLGAFFVSGTVTAVRYDRAVDRLDLAATTVRTSISALCQQLHAAADAVATVTDPAGRAATASQVVARGLAAAVLIADATGSPAIQTAGAPALPWVDCAGSYPAGTAPRALVVRVDIRDERGASLGSVAAAQGLDAAFVGRLAAATGVAVTLLSGGAGPASVVESTESGSARDGVGGAAARVRGDAVTETSGGRYARRVGPSPGQPLLLALSVPRDQSPALYGVLVSAVVCAGLLALLAAWRLARSTTRPLADLAHAADRVAGGDLAVRVPVRAHDEIGRLASAFNRMTRETQAYVQALTASRDQLRGHLVILGHTLSSTHDLKRILQVILESALAASGARAGAVLLLDQSTGTLVGQYAEGGAQRVRSLGVGRLADGDSPDEGPLAGGLPADGAGAGPGAATLRVPLGAGLLGSVAATGEPRRGRVDRRGPVLYTSEPPCRTYMAVPFSAAGPPPTAAAGSHPAPAAGPPPTAPHPVAAPAPRPSGPAVDSATVPVARTAPSVSGVLALYDRLGADEFDASDLVTLRTFADQAAVAVNNVRIHEEAQRLSLTDPLTGLWNYRSLQESIRREVERASRFGRMLTVLALDLDRFKDVNDTYGHAAGDSVLAEFARRVRGALREVDLAFRQGGEEFVVLLPETDARGGAVVAERLGAAVRDTPIMVEPHGGTATATTTSPVSVTVSIGIAVYPDHATSGHQVLDAADDALYAAKSAGRDTYRVAVAVQRPVVEEIAVPAGAASPDDDIPPTGGRTSGGAGGATSGPQPPRQARGR